MVSLVALLEFPPIKVGQNISSTFSLASDQKLILIDACITRGVRAVVVVPKEFLVCWIVAVHTLPGAVQGVTGVVPAPGLFCTRPKVRVPSMSSKFARLKRLYVSQRS